MQQRSRGMSLVSKWMDLAAIELERLSVSDFTQIDLIHGLIIVPFGVRDIT